MGEMVKNRENGQNGQKWSKMVQNGPKWSKMVQNGSKWFKMIHYSLNYQYPEVHF